MEKLVDWLQHRRARNATAEQELVAVGAERKRSRESSAERDAARAANAKLRASLESRIGHIPEPEPEPEQNRDSFSPSSEEEAIGTGLRPKFVAEDDKHNAGQYAKKVPELRLQLEPEPEPEPFNPRHSMARGGVLAVELPTEVPRYKGVSREGTRTPGGEEPPVGSGDIRIYTM